jgi:hypothetical protein
MSEEKSRPGWEWKDTPSGGYWSKVTGESHKHKVPFFCPHCQKPCGNVDEKWLVTYGICWECHTMYVADRVTPAIDITKYRK